jgi:hypothetical protein
MKSPGSGGGNEERRWEGAGGRRGGSWALMFLPSALLRLHCF